MSGPHSISPAPVRPPRQEEAAPADAPSPVFRRSTQDVRSLVGNGLRGARDAIANTAVGQRVSQHLQEQEARHAERNLRVAVENGSPRAFMAALDKAPPREGNTPLHSAALMLHGDVFQPCIRTLLNKRDADGRPPSLTVKNELGDNPVQTAVRRENLNFLMELERALLGRGSGELNPNGFDLRALTETPRDGIRLELLSSSQRVRDCVNRMLNIAQLARGPAEPDVLSVKL